MNGNPIEGEFVPLGKLAVHAPEEAHAHEVGKRHATVSELELIGLALVFVGVGVLGVRWMRDRNLISNSCRPNWFRLGALDIEREMSSSAAEKINQNNNSNNNNE